MLLRDVSTSTISSSDESVVNNFIFPEENKSSHKTVLYQELRLIERNESEINVCWKGAHMMLFFLSFVFGSLCTFCIHRLKSMFGDKCVLFPKVVTYSTVNRMLHEFFSFKSEADNVDPELPPVEFVTATWADNSVCYLPTYVPLVSGLAGLVWTTMFLMCSSGTTHNVTGAQRHWRALPIMFLFSAAMTSLCVYTSTVTQRGLEDLCSKLADVTGSPRCGYSINVVTLAYDRHIHGVYQATVLSIASAWLHTICWLLSTLLIVARVLLAVDFTLVHVKAQLIGNIEDILQKYEKQINSLNADTGKPSKSDIDEEDSELELYNTTNSVNDSRPQAQRPSGRNLNKTNDVIKPSEQHSSSVPLVTEQRLHEKQSRDLLYNLLKNIKKSIPKSSSMSHNEATTSGLKTRKDVNQTTNPTDVTRKGLSDDENAEILAKNFDYQLLEKLTQAFSEFERHIKSNLNNKYNGQDTGVTTTSDQVDYTKKHEDTKRELEKSPSTHNVNNQDMQSKRSHTVQFYDKSNDNTLNSENSQIAGENKDNKNEKSNSANKNKLLRSDELKKIHDSTILHVNKITRQQKKDELKSAINEQISADKLLKSGELRIYDVDYSKEDNKSATDSKITTTNKNKDENQDDENEVIKSEAIEKSHGSGELRILEDTSGDSKSSPDTQKTNDDQKNKEEIRSAINEQNSAYKLLKRGELRIYDDSKEDNKSATDSKITTNNKNKDDNKDDENVENKSEAIEKSHGSGELRILEDTSGDSKSSPDTRNQKTNDDQKNKEEMKSAIIEQNSADKLLKSGGLRIYDDSKEDGKSALDSKMTTNNKNLDENIDDKNVENKSDVIEKSHESGELRILEDTSGDSKSSPDTQKTNDDQKNKEEIRSAINEQNSADKLPKSGELRIYDDSKEDDKSATYSKITTNNKNKDEENVENKSEAIENSHGSGELQILEDTSDDSKSSPDNQKTGDDQGQGKSK